MKLVHGECTHYSKDELEDQMFVIVMKRRPSPRGEG
jgi:hypothetical protein